MNIFDSEHIKAYKILCTSFQKYFILCLMLNVRFISSFVSSYNVTFKLDTPDDHWLGFDTMGFEIFVQDWTISYRYESIIQIIPVRFYSYILFSARWPKNEFSDW
jgi:hypothetical protein